MERAVSPDRESVVEQMIDAPLQHSWPLRSDLAGVVSRIAGYRENGCALSGVAQAAELTVPLVIGFGDPFIIGLKHVPGSNDRWGSFAAGLSASPVFIRSSGWAECIQIDFTPLGAHRFFGLLMNQLSSRMVTLDELDDRKIQQLRHRLGEEPDWSRRFLLAEMFIAERLRGAPVGHGTVRAAYAEILKARGNLRMSSIVKKLDCSRKHLAERFQTEVGLAPKLVARMVRFQHVRLLARSVMAPNVKPDWASAAYAGGYADQAHLVREFSELAGVTPSQWASKAA